MFKGVDPSPCVRQYGFPKAVDGQNPLLLDSCNVCSTAVSRLTATLHSQQIKLETQVYGISLAFSHQEFFRLSFRLHVKEASSTDISTNTCVLLPQAVRLRPSRFYLKSFRRIYDIPNRIIFSFVPFEKKKRKEQNVFVSFECELWACPDHFYIY